MEPRSQTVTLHYLHRACTRFRARCRAPHVPLLKDLHREVFEIAQEIARALPHEHLLPLVEEHPEWMGVLVCPPARNGPLAEMIAHHLGALIEQYLNTHWLTILCQGEEEASAARRRGDE
jgi:hypothetical protein